MTKIILHGGYSSVSNALNDGFWNEFTKDLPNNANILLVYFSRKDEETDQLFAQDTEQIAKTAPKKHFRFTKVAQEDFPKQIEEASALWFRGGNTVKLLEAIETTPSFIKALNGKVLAGSSAGAYLFSTYNHSATDGKIRKGLGVLPIRLICHYQTESNAFDVGDEAITKMRELPDELELVILKDYEWRVFHV